MLCQVRESIARTPNIYQLGVIGYKNIKMFSIDTLGHEPLDFRGSADATSTMFPTAQTTDILRLSSDKGSG